MIKIAPKDFKDRTYLSAIESAKFLGVSVSVLHNLANRHIIKAQIATSGQMRFDLKELKKYETDFKCKPQKRKTNIDIINATQVNGTVQKIFVKNSMEMKDLSDDSIHLMVTSPPYFNTKMYSREPIESDLGDIHDVDEWFDKISEV